MTKSLWHRRRAERFARLLDEVDGGPRQRARSRHDEELTELVALRRELADTPTPEPDPDFRAGLRTMLVAAAERQHAESTAEPEPTEPRTARRTARRAGGALARGPRARTAVIAGVAVGTMAFTGMSTASENAVPGDTLYGVKRSTERAQLALASSDVGRAQLYLDFARTRLAEARSLPSGLDRVLDDMDRDTTAGVNLLTTTATNRRDPAALTPIDAFVNEQRGALGELSDHVEGTDHARVGASLALLDTIEERADELRDDLAAGCPAATSVDVLGPLPESCLTPPSPAALGPLAGQGNQPETLPAQPDTGAPLPRVDAADEDGEQETSQTPREERPDRSTTSGTSADPTPATDEQVVDDVDLAEADDSGLLTGFNRLLGNLLGK